MTNQFLCFIPSFDNDMMDDDISCDFDTLNQSIEFVIEYFKNNPNINMAEIYRREESGNIIISSILKRISEKEIVQENYEPIIDDLGEEIEGIEPIKVEEIIHTIKDNKEIDSSVWGFLF